jgi:ATP-binding cassette subfamily B protein
MWNRQLEASQAEELLRQTANDPDGFVQRGRPAAE